jgi:hypothetical protein
MGRINDAREPIFPALDSAGALYERLLRSATKMPVKVPVIKAIVQYRVQSILLSH